MRNLDPIPVHPNDAPRRSSPWVLRGLGVVAVAIVAGPIASCVFFPGRAFDAAVWHDQSQIESGVRAAMADRMVARGTLIGRTGAEVIALLGPPDVTYHDRIEYDLGPSRGLFGFAEYFDIELGPDGRVLRCWTWSD